ncbi:MAG: hypothetical protein ACLR23_18330 [Clostridia bacterium]
MTLSQGSAKREYWSSTLQRQGICSHAYKRERPRKGIYQTTPRWKNIGTSDRARKKLWDFDLGDEYILERHGAVEDTTLMVGQQQYKAVIIPGDMKNMRGSTYELVRKFAENGGAVLCCERPGAYIDGKVSEKHW